MCHPFAVSRGLSSANSHDESPRATQRRKSTAYQGDSTLSHRALVPHTALRQAADRIHALAWHPNDGVDPAPTSAASVDHDAGQKGGRSRRVNARGGCPTPHAFTGRMGLDPSPCEPPLTTRCFVRLQKEQMKS